MISSAQPAADSSTAETGGAEPLLSIRSIAKRFGSTTVLRDVSLDVAPGELLTILGESGSGKTTLLRLIAGFEQPDGGDLHGLLFSSMPKKIMLPSRSATSNSRMP